MTDKEETRLIIEANKLEIKNKRIEIRLLQLEILNLKYYYKDKEETTNGKS